MPLIFVCVKSYWTLNLGNYRQNVQLTYSTVCSSDRRSGERHQDIRLQKCLANSHRNFSPAIKNSVDIIELNSSVCRSSDLIWSESAWTLRVHRHKRYRYYSFLFFLQRGLCIQRRASRPWQWNDVLLSSGVCLLTCECCCVDFHCREQMEEQYCSRAHENEEIKEEKASSCSTFHRVSVCLTQVGPEAILCLATLKLQFVKLQDHMAQLQSSFQVLNSTLHMLYSSQFCPSLLETEGQKILHNIFMMELWNALCLSTLICNISCIRRAPHQCVWISVIMCRPITGTHNTYRESHNPFGLWPTVTQEHLICERESRV